LQTGQWKISGPYKAKGKKKIFARDNWHRKPAQLKMCGHTGVGAPDKGSRGGPNGRGVASKHEWVHVIGGRH